jgi:hypothetical protein
MKTCLVCSADVPDESVTCASCGCCDLAQVAAANDEPPPPPAGEDSTDEPPPAGEKRKRGR